MESDATDALGFVQETYASWLDCDPEPTAWYAEYYLGIMLGHLSKLRSPPVGEELATIRADYMALVRRHLPGDLEQACYIAGNLSYVRADAIGEILDHIDGLLETDGSGLSITDVVETYRLSAFVRSIIGERIANRIAAERGEPGHPIEPPVRASDPLDPDHYAGLVLALWLGDHRQWGPTVYNALAFFNAFVAAPGPYRRPREGRETTEARASFVALATPHLTDDLGHARHLAVRLADMAMVHDAEKRRHEMELLLDAIEILLVEDGRGLMIPDVVAIDELATLARETTQRRLAGTLARTLRRRLP